MKTVLITGCSSGVGRAAVLQFASLGYRVYAGVRSQADADSLLLESGSGEVVTLILDILSREARRAAVDRLNADLAGSGLDVLINNAGIAKFVPLEFVPESEIRQTFEVNTLGPVLLTQALMPLLRLAKGKIILVGSIGGRISFSFNGPYSISKFALAGYADALRRELEGSGVNVSLLEPGSIATPMLDKVEVESEAAISSLTQEGRLLYEEPLRKYLDTLPGSKKYATPPGQIAKFMGRVAATKNPKARYAVTPDARALFFMQWLLPSRWFDWVLRKSVDFSRLLE